MALMAGADAGAMVLGAWYSNCHVMQAQDGDDVLADHLAALVHSPSTAKSSFGSEVPVGLKTVAMQ